MHRHHKHNRAQSQITIAKVISAAWESKENQWTINGKSMVKSHSQSGSLSLRLDFTSPSKSASKSEAFSSSLEMMISSPESGVLSV